MKQNRKSPGVARGSSAPASSPASDMLELRRAVATCLLWEDTATESSAELYNRIRRLAHACPYQFVADVAVQARQVHRLRHVPLLLLRELARHAGRAAHEAQQLSALFPQIITRADQITDFVCLYWADNGGKKTLPKQVKKGLAACFEKFDAYQLAKYSGEGKTVSLRDIAFLVHPSKTKYATDYVGPIVTRERIYKGAGGRVVGVGQVMRHEDSALDQLVKKTLPTPDTWESKLSAARGLEARRTVWTELLQSNGLGALAWARNLRNMRADNVSEDLVLGYADVLLERGKATDLFPHQILRAAAEARWAEPALQKLLLAPSSDVVLPGRTAILVDVSGSMGHPVAGKSDVKRIDAAVALAVLARQACGRADVWSFSEKLVLCSEAGEEHRGFVLVDRIVGSQAHRNTYARAAVAALHGHYGKEQSERILVITDEQSTDGELGAVPAKRGYVMNIATDARTLAGSERWVSISGWSAHVLNWIAEHENIETC